MTAFEVEEVTDGERMMGGEYCHQNKVSIQGFESINTDLLDDWNSLVKGFITDSIGFYSTDTSVL